MMDSKATTFLSSNNSWKQRMRIDPYIGVATCCTGCVDLAAGGLDVRILD